MHFHSFKTVVAFRLGGVVN
uniref:Uncharacterized protein n=1 Tax=Arundo donax TaxID=35708 RepID=A0A0A9A267_ARUDO